MLQDHFRPPLSTRRHWHAFHNAWATYLAAELNRVLPPNYFAEPNVQFSIEIDVAAFEETEAVQPDNAPHALSLVVPDSWTPMPATHTVAFEPLAESIEIGLFDNTAGPVLAAAIELVSPANKDRPAQRDAFVAKCQSYLQQGLGLIVIDLVTTRKANLHNDLMARLGATTEPFDTELYAVAYHALERESVTQLDLWQESLAVGRTLPTLPLWLRGGPCIPLALQATYERTCREQRILADAA